MPDLSILGLQKSVDDYHDADDYPGVRLDHTSKRVQDAVEAVVESYQAGGIEWNFPFSDGGDFDSEFEVAFESAQAEVNRQSGPGYPYRLFSQQNGKFLDQFGAEVKERVKERIRTILFDGHEFEKLADEPLSWLRLGLRDPDRLFPKNQALPKRKPLPRVICGASIVDQLVTRIFFQGFAKSEGKCYPHVVTTKKGVGFSDEHAQAIGEQVELLSELFGAPPKVSDVKGWEKTFDRSVAECSRRPMIMTCKNYQACIQCFHRSFEWWKHSLCTNCAVFDDGTLIVFMDDKVQRSGNYLTTTSNGIGRATCAFLVGSVPCTAGDDCFEWSELSVEELIEAYKSIGLTVRDVSQVRPNSVDFCSHHFYKKGGCDGAWTCYLFAHQRMLWEASRDRKIDPNSDENWLKEIENAPDCDFVDKVKLFLNERNRVLRAVAGHAKARSGCGTAETTARTTEDEKEAEEGYPEDGTSSNCFKIWESCAED
nr:RNA-dependent RNA polymerase [Sobelivirales sp.]